MQRLEKLSSKEQIDQNGLDFNLSGNEEDFRRIASRYRIYYNEEDMRSLVIAVRDGNYGALEVLTKISINILLEILNDRYTDIDDRDLLYRRGLEILIEGQRKYFSRTIQRPYKEFIKAYIQRELAKEYDEPLILKALYDKNISFPFGNFLSDDILTDFLKNAQKFPRGTARSFRILIEEYKKGNDRARDLLIITSLYLLLNNAEKMKRKTGSLCPVMDLLQEEYLALINVIENYDPSHPSRRGFVNYLNSALEKEMRKFLNIKFNMFKTEHNIIKMLDDYKSLVAKCSEEGKPLPDDDELMKILRITPESLEMLKREVPLEVDSYEEKFDEEGIDIACEEYVASNNLADNHLMLYLKQRFSPYEYFILYSLVFEEVSVTEIGKDLGISRQQIENIYSRLLKKIKTMNFKRNEFVYRLDPDSVSAINRLSTRPLDIELKLSYMFLKDFLSHTQRKLLKLLAEKKYKDDDRTLAALMGVSIDEYKKIRASLMSVLEILKTDLKDDFEQFKQYMISMMTHYIYTIDFDFNLSYLEDLFDDVKLLGASKINVLK